MDEKLSCAIISQTLPLLDFFTFSRFYNNNSPSENSNPAHFFDNNQILNSLHSNSLIINFSTSPSLPLNKNISFFDPSSPLSFAPQHIFFWEHEKVAHHKRKKIFIQIENEEGEKRSLVIKILTL